jgi:hypothetical protein
MTNYLRSTFGRTVLAASVVAFLSGAVGVVYAQHAQEHEGHADEAATAEQLPTARDVLDDYVVAVGGKKAVRKVKSMTMIGQLDIPAAGISGSLEIRAMAPNKALLTAEIPGMGQIREGFDGEVAWSMDPNMGPRLKDGDELVQAKFQADFYGTLHAADRYKSMETVEKTDVDGTTCYKIRLVTRDGDEIFEYFDVDNGLMIGTEMEAESPMGAIKVFSKMGDYRQVKGVKLPTRLTQSIGPMEQIMKFSDVSLDDVDPAVFELPAEIRALTEE